MQLERQAAVEVAHLARGQPGFDVDADRPDVERAIGQLTGQLRAVQVIDVQHRGTQARPAEELALGHPVGLHGAVVIKVVAR